MKKKKHKPTTLKPSPTTFFSILRLSLTLFGNVPRLREMCYVPELSSTLDAIVDGEENIREMTHMPLVFH
jgi:hypothetical protein